MLLRRVLLALFALQIGASAVQAGDSRLNTMGRSLCEVALQGRLSAIKTRPLLTVLQGHNTRAYCTCVGHSMGQDSTDLLRAIATENAGDFKRQALFNAAMARHMAACLPLDGAPDPRRLALSRLTDLATCESALEGNLAVPGLRIAAFRGDMAQQGQSRAALCNCTARHMRASITALDRARASETGAPLSAYSGFLGQAMTSCLKAPCPGPDCPLDPEDP